MPGRLYFDNAATSFPKPPCVHEAMERYARECGSPARGAHDEARHAASLVNECRQRICRLINGERPEQVVFTLNTTDAMNMAIRGIVHHRLRTTTGPVHLITTELDHNSALRPLNTLVEAFPGRITQTRLPLDPLVHVIDPEALRAAIKPETALFVTLHASNVTGAIQPIERYGEVCRERGVTFLVDAAQSLGHVAFDAQAALADLVAFPGHKGLLGPTGTGGLYVRPGVERRMDTVREGGTGWRSEDEQMPSELPERFEPGSHNTIGIAGLSAAVGWILERGIERLREHELELMNHMLVGLAASHELRLLGPTRSAERVGVFTLAHKSMEAAVLRNALDQSFGVIARSGLHCAPLVHERYGTKTAGGGTRLSLGPFVTRDQCTIVCNCLMPKACERQLYSASHPRAAAPLAVAVLDTIAPL